MVRTLTSHQCGPGSYPGAGMWVEFFVGSLPCCERFFSGYSGFPLSPKTNISKSNSTRNQVDEEPLRGCATSKSLFIIHYLLSPMNDLLPYHNNHFMKASFKLLLLTRCRVSCSTRFRFYLPKFRPWLLVSRLADPVDLPCYCVAASFRTIPV